MNIVHHHFAGHVGIDSVGARIADVVAAYGQVHEQELGPVERRGERPEGARPVRPSLDDYIIDQPHDLSARPLNGVGVEVRHRVAGRRQIVALRLIDVGASAVIVDRPTDCDRVRPLVLHHVDFTTSRPAYPGRRDVCSQCPIRGPKAHALRQLGAELDPPKCFPEATLGLQPG